MPRADFVCAPRLRVRWAEVDMQKIDDVLAVCCRVAKLGRSSLTFHFEIYREAEEAALATAELVYVNADPSSMRAAPLPEELRERVRRYERTAPQA